MPLRKRLVLACSRCQAAISAASLRRSGSNLSSRRFLHAAQCVNCVLLVRPASDMTYKDAAHAAGRVFTSVGVAAACSGQFVSNEMCRHGGSRPFTWYTDSRKSSAMSRGIASALIAPDALPEKGGEGCESDRWMSLSSD